MLSAMTSSHCTVRRFGVLCVALALAFSASCDRDGDGDGDLDASIPGDGGTSSDGAIFDPPDGFCDAPDAGYGHPCSVTMSCPCGTICSAKACVPQAACSEAVLSWVGPTSNTDDSCVDLAGFKIYWGSVQGGPYEHSLDVGLTPCVADISVGCGDMGQVAEQKACGYRMTGLGNGTWFFAVAAYSSTMEESVPSMEASKVITCP